MNRLEEARKAINEIDAEMATLFCRRMDAVEAVAEYKKEHHLQILDASREAEVLFKNLKTIEEEKYKKAYQKFLKNIMEISKEYQELFINQNKER